MIDLYLSLGSNMGDRAANISEAIKRLEKSFGVGLERASHVIETESWGFDAPDFLNCAVLFSLPRKRQSAESQALEILSVVKGIEKEMGRKETLEYDIDGNRMYHSRTIDIDILYFGRHRIDLPQLQIPHPLITEREFVMIPLLEIAKSSLKRAFPVLLKGEACQ